MNPNGMPPQGPPPGMPKPPQFRELTEEAYNKKFSIQFTRRELTAIFNILHTQKYGIPDAKIIVPIIDKIHDPVVVLTNQDYVPEQNVPTQPAANPEKLKLN